MIESELKTALLISGSGTTAEAVIQACQKGEISRVTPVVVISSNPLAEGLAKAKMLKIPTETIVKRDYKTSDAFGEALLALLKKYSVNLVSQNGWLPSTPPNVVSEYSGWIINQHPGPLDPGPHDFGGKGMYGARVTCARLAYLWATRDPDPWTASTVHYVSNEYDKGDLIQVSRLNIPPYSGSITIAELITSSTDLVQETQRVKGQLLPVEHDNVKSVLRKFGDGTVQSWRRQTSLVPEANYETLEAAKSLAIQLYPKG